MKGGKNMTDAERNEEGTTEEGTTEEPRVHAPADDGIDKITVVIGGNAKDYPYNKQRNTPARLMPWLRKRGAAIPPLPKILIDDESAYRYSAFDPGAKIEFRSRWGSNG